jgi:predicted alpha/beta hydrolase
MTARHTEGDAVKPPARFTFAAADGTPLAGTLYEPEAARRPAVLVAGALGVAQRHYAAFASWLAGRGHVVMTFDLRGMGASRQPQHRRSLRGLDADLLTWARSDFPAAVSHLVAVNSGEPITVIGHSLGLHHAGMTDQKTQGQIAHAIGVASGAGYWRDWAAPSRRLAPVMLHVAAPVLVPLFGYFPGKRLRMVADLPASAMRQWSRWCRHPEFAWGAEPDRVRPSLLAARFPVTAFSFTDDEAMTETCTRKLLAAFSSCHSRLIRLAPADVGLRHIGHLGAFSATGTELLWRRMAAAIDNPAAEH